MRSLKLNFVLVRLKGPMKREMACLIFYNIHQTRQNVAYPIFYQIKIPLFPPKVSSFQWLVQSGKRTSTLVFLGWSSQPCGHLDKIKHWRLLPYQYVASFQTNQTNKLRIKKYCHFMGPFHKTNATFL